MQKTKGRLPILVAELLILAVLLAVLVYVVHWKADRAQNSEPAQVQTEPETAQVQTEPEEIYMQYGSGGGTDIDTSVLTYPETKNNLDLVAFAQQAWENRWGYVWGTFGYVLTEELLADKLLQYPQAVGDFEGFIRENWMGRRVADCIGLVKAYSWLDAQTGQINYPDGMPDIGTEDLFEAAEEKGTIDTIPEIIGLLVYREGHVGIYLGGGYVIESAGTEVGVVKTELSQQPFTHWMKCPYIEYLA